MRGLRVVIVTIAVLAAGAPVAVSFWTSPATAGSAGQAKARSLPQASTPTASAVGPTVTIRWAATSFTGATLGYRLYRDGTPVPCTPADAGNGNLECVEASVPPGVHQWTVATTLADNWVGPQSNPSPAITVYNDLTPPTTTASDSPAPNGAGWHNTSPVGVTLTAADNSGGSGVQAIRYTLDGSDPRSSGTAATYTSPIAVSATTTIRYSAIDNANNEEAPQSHVVQIDQVAPANSLSVNAVTGGAHLAGNTVWYRGAAAGSFRIVNAVSDASSGPGGSSTAALGGVATGWTHAPSTVTTPAGGPYASALFSWVAGTASAPTEVVTGLDRAGNATAAPALTFSVDNTAPTTTASLNPAANGSGWNNTAVTVTLSASDAASGVARIRYTTDGTDPTVSGTAVTYSGPFAVAATSTVRFSATDNVGNVEAPKTQAVQIDSVAPVNALSLQNVSGNVLLSGSTVFYRGVAAGGFRIRNTMTDSGGSGAATSTTSALGGTATGWTHTGSTVTAPFVSNPFSWLAGTTSSPTVTVTGADLAGNTSPTTLTFTNDSTGPAGGATFPAAAATYAGAAAWNAGCGTAGTGDICGSPTDAGSGIASVSLVIRRLSDNRCLNPANGNWNNGACGGVAPTTFNPAGNPVWTASFACLADSFTLTITQTDNLTNATTVPAQAWQVTSCA